MVDAFMYLTGCTVIFIVRPIYLVACKAIITFLIAILSLRELPLSFQLKPGRAFIQLASTEQYGILENPSPGDITLADRGFTVEDAVGLIVLKLLLLLSVLKVKNKIRRLVKGNIYHMQEFITCDFSPIYNSEGHYYDYTSKKTIEISDIRTIGCQYTGLLCVLHYVITDV